MTPTSALRARIFSSNASSALMRLEPRRLCGVPAAGVAQRHRAVELRLSRLGVHAIGDEIAVALELKVLLGPRFLERGLELRADHLLRIRIQVLQKIPVARARMRHFEEAVVEPHLRRMRMPRAQ